MSTATRTTTVHGDAAVLTYEPLVPALIEESVRSVAAGAVVSFVGYTRNVFQGRTVSHLEYESYVPLAIKTMHSILLEARALPALPPSSNSTCCHQQPVSAASSPSATTEDHPANSPGTIALTSLTIHHLLGPSPPLTPSLVICVASPHRAEAFFVCEWLLERVKERVQVWKREFYDDGESFEGKDGEGIEGPGSRSPCQRVGVASSEASRWKENFP